MTKRPLPPTRRYSKPKPSEGGRLRKATAKFVKDEITKTRSFQTPRGFLVDLIVAVLIGLAISIGYLYLLF